MLTNNCLINQGTVAQMSACLPHDQKVMGSNPAGSYETKLKEKPVCYTPIVVTPSW